MDNRLVGQSIFDQSEIGVITRGWANATDKNRVLNLVAIPARRAHTSSHSFLSDQSRIKVLILNAMKQLMCTKNKSLYSSHQIRGRDFHVNEHNGESKHEKAVVHTENI